MSVANGFITWLQLSDMHFRANQQWDQNIVLDSLFRDVLTGLPDLGLLPDLVFVTGDIANTGRPEEYERAAAFFAEVARVTRTEPRVSWFLVPGNHDVDRSLIKAVTRITAAAIQTTSEVSDLLADEDARALFTHRQRAFFEFTSSFLGSGRAWSESAPWKVEVVEVAGSRIAIIGLNSSWNAEGGEQDQARLLLGEYQVRELLSAGKKGAPLVTIGLLHHPLDWFRSFDQERIRSLLLGPGGVQFLLRGHLHMGRIARQESPDANCIELAAGALWQDATYPHGITITQLDTIQGTCTVHMFRYSSEGRGFWKYDNFLYENMQDGTWTFDLPRSWKIGLDVRSGARRMAARPSTVPTPLEVHLTCEWDQSSYQAETDLCRVLVTVQVDEPAHRMRAAITEPVHHLLLLDVSGSMNVRDKYPVLTESVDAYLRILAPRDLISIIPFSTVADVVVSETVEELLQRHFRTEAALAAWPYRFASTLLTAPLRLAIDEIERAKDGGFDGVVRLLCLTDGRIYDYLEARPLAQALGASGIGMNLFGFGTDFDVANAEALVAENDGTVRYVRTTDTELEEYFGHMARTSQRIVFREATVRLDLAEGVTCFDAFLCRPQERHIGRFDTAQTLTVRHTIRAMRYGTPYMLLFELRAWEPRPTLGRITVEASGAMGTFRMNRDLAPIFANGPSEINDFVHKMADSLRGLTQTDRDTQMSALEARIALYVREARPKQHIDALERQLKILRAGGNLNELSDDDRRFANADPGTATHIVLPL